MGCVFAVLAYRKLQRNRVVALSGMETAAMSAAAVSSSGGGGSHGTGGGGHGGSGGGVRWAAPRRASEGTVAGPAPPATVVVQVTRKRGTVRPAQWHDD